MGSPYMPFYVADYLGDTKHLTTEQHGAYLLLLLTMWRCGGSLPDDEGKLARIVGLTPARWRRVSPDVMAFFDREEGRVTQKRLVAEIEKANGKHRQTADAGSKGGRAKALKSKAQLLADASPPPAYARAFPEPLSEPGTADRDIPLSEPLELCINNAPRQQAGGVLVEFSQPKRENIPENDEIAQKDAIAQPQKPPKPREYPEDFEDLWREYQPIASPNSTKFDAFKVWQKLSQADRIPCWHGVVSYTLWVLEQRKTKTEFPAKHLSTFIAKRGWEPFLEYELTLNGAAAWRA